MCHSLSSLCLSLSFQQQVLSELNRWLRPLYSWDSAGELSQWYRWKCNGDLTGFGAEAYDAVVSSALRLNNAARTRHA